MSRTRDARTTVTALTEAPRSVTSRPVTPRSGAPRSGGAVRSSRAAMMSRSARGRAAVVAPPSRRDEVVAIAAGVFAERGFAGVTVDDIGAACGMSGPALYHHFASKEAILGEMLVAISEHLSEQAEAVVATSSDPRQTLLALIAVHTEFAVTQSDLITVHFRDLVHASDADQRRVRRLQRRYVEHWVDSLTAGSPDLDPKTARAGVHAMLGLINSTPFSQRLARDEMIAMLRLMALGALDAMVLGAARP
jgi:AcrR family transcriptional regulator